MTHRARDLCLAAVAFVAVSPPWSAAAQSLDYVSQDRRVSASYVIFTTGEGESKSFVAPDFGPFAATASVSGAGASQDSMLEGTQIQGDLGASSNWDDEGGARSRLRVTFSLASTTPYSATGFLTGQGASLSLQALGGPAVFALSGTGFGFGSLPEAFELTGLLPPGTYDMLVEANQSYSYGASEASFTFLVPEPSASTLVALGLAQLCLCRRRRGRPSLPGRGR